MDMIGRYEILGEVGRGAMGRVLLAHDPLLGRDVAIKSGLLDGIRSEEREVILRRLIREARAASALNHPNIVAVYDVLQEGNSVSIVMEFVKGRDLADAVELASIADRDLVRKVVSGCADALDHAHSRGIVHRDVKPSNILISDSGAIKITDFGIARIAAAKTDLTQQGFAIGTLQYMAPEQMAGAKVDGRADQYSLAAVTYQLLTGYRPYEADTPEGLFYQITTKAAAPASTRNPALSKAVDTVLAKALAKKPNERYLSCRDFVEQLESALAVDPAAESTLFALFRAPKSTLWRTGLVTGASLLLASCLFWWRMSTSTQSGNQSSLKKDRAEAPDRLRPKPPEVAKSIPAATTPNTNVAPPSRIEQPPVMSGSPSRKTAPVAPPSTPARPPRQGDIRQNDADGLEYVWIPAGEFIMGCSDGDTECDGDEKPPHPVHISRAFWIGQTEVTQRAWQRVMGNNPSRFKGPDLPVDTISWRDAALYCRKIGGALPTEAEWEYAARAGVKAPRYGPVDSIAWYPGNSGSKTHPVGQKAPNALGLYDVLGNAWEWTADWYDKKFYRLKIIVDPGGPASGRVRAMRGGSSGYLPWTAPRLSGRLWGAPEGRYDLVGCRCAKDSL